MFRLCMYGMAGWICLSAIYLTCKGAVALWRYVRRLATGQPPADNF